ncbi:cubilin-like [Clavelina lepadiformis]|uniref:cubilin-like n=1 Tax=Clavelina lepadiformis TaxID=159417 RepID=UPI0040426ED2
MQRNAGNLIIILSVVFTLFISYCHSTDECGTLDFDAELNKEKQIQQPGYPEDYGNYLQCSYIFRSSPGTRIRFWFNNFGTQKCCSTSSYTIIRNPACCGYFQYYDVGSIIKNTINFPKSDDTSRHYSSSSEMSLYLHLARNTIYSGFSLTYTAVETCGTALNTSSHWKNITSPGFPNHHHSNQICTWTITAPYNHVINISTHFVNNETCCTRLQARESRTDLYQLSTGTHYLSRGTNLAIDFISEKSVMKKGFRLSYRAVHVCGVLHFDAELNKEKQIKQPGYPWEYPSYLQCSYTFRSPPGTRIRFWFNNFGTQKCCSTSSYTISRNPACCGYFQYYDVGSMIKNTINFPKSDDTSRHYSSSSEMSLYMHLARDTIYSGFSLTYTAVEECGTALNTSSHWKNITSPGFPNHHHSNQICTWTITAPYNHVINISTHFVNNETCCTRLQARESRTDLYQLSTDTHYLSRGTNLAIDFISEKSVMKKGFRLSYRAVHVCGILHFDAELNKEKQIKQPGYPWEYPSYLQCSYTFRSPPGTRIRFWFNNFGTQKCCSTSSYTISRNPACCGYFQYYDVGSMIKNTINFPKSDETSRHYSSSSEMSLYMHLARDTIYSGFSLTYTAVEECGTALNTSSHWKNITSPGFPNHHHSNQICTWTITAPYNHVINISTHFVNNETCCTRLQARESRTDLYQLSTGTHYLSRGTNLAIDFISEKSVMKKGFRLSYRAVHVCGILHFDAELNKEKQIKQPGYPWEYPSYLQCSYTFRSPPGTRIRFWFNNFGTQKCCSTSSYTISRNPACCGYFQYYDVGSMIKNTINFPKSDDTSRHYSSSSEMSLYMHLARDTIYSGFSLTYTAVEECGTALNTSSHWKNITSPGFPNHHHSNQICTWTITAPYNHVINISTHFVNNETCCTRLQARESRTDLYQLSTDTHYLSRGTNLAIDFISEKSVMKKGFRLSYRAVHVCGILHFDAELNKEKQIKQPGYPWEYPSYLQCSYTFRSPPGTRIRFWFNNFGTQKCCSTSSYTISRNPACCGYFQYYDVGSMIKNTINFPKSDDTSRHYSSSSEMSLYMHLARDTIYSGFSLTYTAVETCGTALNTSSHWKNITSPGFPNHHHSNQICTWTITAPYNHVINISTHFVNNETCCTRLQARESRTDLYQLSTGTHYLSRGTNLAIDFISEKSVMKKGFRLSYRAACCGYFQYYDVGSMIKNTINFPKSDDTSRHYSSSSEMSLYMHLARDTIYSGFSLTYTAVEECGTALNTSSHWKNITSPGFPNHHHSNQICTWTITAPYNHVINISTHFVNNETCCTRLQARESRTDLYQLSTGTHYLSRGTNLAIDFISEKSVMKKGFRLSYRAVHVCGILHFDAELNKEKQIKQPGYPWEYPSYLQCSYTFRSPPGTRIRFWFNNFGTQKCCSTSSYTISRNPACCGYFQYYDVGSMIKNTINFPKSDDTSRHYSSSSEMSLYMHLARDTIYSGFSLTYTAVETCGTALNTSSHWKNITSPGFPNHHHSNQICTWTITAPYNHVINISTHFVNNETCCTRLQARESRTDLYQLSTGTHYLSRGTNLAIDFISEKSVMKKGFRLSYRAVHVCGVLHFDAELNKEKQIKQPGYPWEYPSYLQCSYTFRSPPGTRIRFWFNNFGTQKCCSTSSYTISRNPACCGYFQYYDVGSMIKNTINFPKSDDTSRHYSSSSEMSLYMHLARDTIYSGFSLTYTAVEECGTALNTSSHWKNITSPGFPNHHHSNQICTWTITAPYNNVINISTHFVNNETCCTRLQARESRTDLYQLSTGTHYLSRGTNLAIDFISEKSVMKKGFRLSYRAVHVCGILHFDAELNKEKQIKQPGYPWEYPSYLQCSYTFRSPPGTRIRFWFNNFGTQKCCSTSSYTISRNPACCGYFQYYDVGSMIKNTINFPKSDDTSRHYSSSSEMSLYMHLARDTIYSGFSLTYTAVETCGTALNTSSHWKNITSPGFPNHHHSNQICTWTITAPYNHVINISTHFVNNETCCTRLQRRV